MASSVKCVAEGWEVGVTIPGKSTTVTCTRSRHVSTQLKLLIEYAPSSQSKDCLTGTIIPKGGIRLSCCLFKPPLRYGGSSIASCLSPILSGIGGFKMSHVEGFKSLSAADKRNLVATLDETLPATPPREEFQMKRLQTPSNVPRVGARVSMLFDDGQKYPVRFHSQEQPHHIAHNMQRITRTTFNITHSKTHDNNNNNNNSTSKRTSKQAGKTSHTYTMLMLCKFKAVPMLCFNVNCCCVCVVAPPLLLLLGVNGDDICERLW